ncbi:Acetyl-CoA carboxylase, carboxyltransferase component [Tangfeifania diversioriginum]|uniref:Propionyl-CoA carboxylase beta chain n=1 Tax=Tangfeifania diversioriginum TaxID=1168035 RepID=A0A1M6MLX1_9BACT|nr:acyl-CoA carboxylase subunit beta [Tangfeifania diversioriginum]SHJ84481.1 Acetyl-CoA carboxylase, carboxyltransferase component [Tangfeifania diversioriginum]
MKVSEKIELLKKKREEALAMGGGARIEKQHQKGKLTARERLDLLFDNGTFREIDMLVKHRSVNFGMEKVDINSDGVIVGHGKVNGRTVFAFSQDFTSRGGSLGEMHAAKISKVMDLAVKAGAPVVGLNDSGGARVEEGVDALKGYGEIFMRNSRASGVIPQISAIMGPCAGGAVYSPAMTDFVYMVKKKSHMFITSPYVIKTVTGEETTFEELGGAMAHNAKSGNAHFACESDEETIESIIELLSYLPNNNLENAPIVPMGDDPARVCEELDTIIPDDAKMPYDMKNIIESVLDHDSFYEVHEHYAENAIVGFGRLNNQSVGIIANQPLIQAGCLDIDASDKISRFVRTCDAFNIPLVTFVDVPGYLPGVQQEQGGIIRHGAKLLWSYAEATVPKFTVVTRKDYGGAYLAMCSKQLGADMVFAWPTAEIAVMGAKGAVEVISTYRKEINEAEDKAAKTQEKIDEYEEAFNVPYRAAQRGYIDAVIIPSETRMRLIDALEAMSTKTEVLPAKKHGNIPL